MGLLILVLWSPVRLAAATAPLAQQRAHAQQLGDAMAEDIRLLSGVKDPVLCETPVICFASGREFAFDVFLISQQVRTGRRDEAISRPVD